MMETTNNTALAPAKVLRTPDLAIKDLKVNPVSIFLLQSREGKTETIMNFIKSVLARPELKDVSWHNDEYGNLYATKGKLAKGETYPAFVSHTDTVHLIYKTKHVYKTANNDYFAMTYDNGPEQIGIGGDDFCGVFVCLELLHRLKKVKCAFFLDEEGGCKGSAKGELEFFDNCRYAIQVDRKGNSDIIVDGSGTILCSDEFKNSMDALGEVYGYKSTDGRRSDVIKLKERGLKISVCNLSAGYYKEHTKQEYVNERDLLNVLDFCIAISKDKKVYPHEYKPKVYTATAYNHGRGYSPITDNSKKRMCAMCEKSELSWNDGIMCRSCMNEQWEEWTLKVNKTTGQKSLIIRDALEDEINDIGINFGPADKCTFCSTPLLTTPLQTRGYCLKCAKCKYCDELLVLKQELLNGECAFHDKICSDRECGNKLKDDVEIMEGVCRQCKAEYMIMSI
jgi:tripeptide aminopeptidase